MELENKTSEFELMSKDVYENLLQAQKYFEMMAEKQELLGQQLTEQERAGEEKDFYSRERLNMMHFAVLQIPEFLKIKIDLDTKLEEAINHIIKLKNVFREIQDSIQDV
jgi:hypothetical protein